jgi:phosphate ABC transporter phosphate-binding protein
VQSIYVEPLAGLNGANQLREALIKRLEKSGPFKLVDNPAQADALMKGEGGLWVRGYNAINYRSPADNRVPVYGGYLSVQLTNREGEPLWSYLVTPSNLGWKSVVDDMTSTLVKQLIAARVAPGTTTAGAAAASKLGATLAGAGATFPQPLYQSWFDSLRQSRNINITYAAVGSQEGMRLLAEKKVDFAASEVDPSEDYELAGSSGSFLRVASVLGGVVPAYNLPEIHQDLRFTGDVLADIYLGKIKRWNDPRIAKWNKNLSLPDAPIVVIHRADGSGTTYTWSAFLASASPEWKLNVGIGMLLTWPTGVGADGNVGVASTVKSTLHSIGYMEMVYAIHGQIAFGAVRNRAGEFVRADLESLGVAVIDVKVGPGPEPKSAPLEPLDKRAYPIATFTWLLVPREMAAGDKKTAVVELMRWALTSGQKACSALGYVPLPKELAERELGMVEAWQ